MGDHIGQEIKRLREARDFNQAQLAVLIGTGPAAISRIENGKQNPNSVTLVKLARALEVEVADLFPKSSPRLPIDDIPEDTRQPWAPKDIEQYLTQMAITAEVVAVGIRDILQLAESAGRSLSQTGAYVTEAAAAYVTEPLKKLEGLSTTAGSAGERLGEGAASRLHAALADLAGLVEQVNESTEILREETAELVEPRYEEDAQRLLESFLESFPYLQANHQDRTQESAAKSR